MMKATFLVFTMLLTVAPAASLSFDLAEAKNRPVTKVLTLLKDMLKQLEKESAEDQEIYDELACWCKTNDKGKAEAISDAEDKIDILSDQISELTATSARLTNEIENLEKEIAANEAALAKATSVREKQLAAFTEEEKDLLESISSLSEALNVLSKHKAASFMQVQHKSMRDVGVSLQKMMKKHAPLLSGVLTRKERRAIASFVQAPQDYFDATPTFKQSYGAQSGEIFGVLGQLKESFEGDLASSQKDEETDQASYEGLKKAKTKEIESGMAMVDDKKDQLAETDEKNSAQKQDLEDTENALSADSKFLATLKQKCSQTDLEYEERLKTRRLEIEAVSKALVVLSGDDALDLQSRTFSFTQKASSAHSSRQAKASAFLTTVAKRLNNPRLATLAVRVRLDAFTKVKKAIDGMIVKLLEEKEAEIKKKDFCVDELNTNQLQTEKKTRDKEDLIAKIEDLESTIKSLTDTIANLKAEIAEMQVQLKRAGEDREKENKEFQDTVADQRETQKLLAQALTYLKGFYAKAAAAALVQKQEPAGPPPPPGFETYKKSAASGGVMSLIEQIMSDAKAMEDEAIKSETDAQKAYEAFVTNTNASIEANSKDIVNKSEAKAKAEKDLVDAKEDKANVEMDLEQLATYKAELHTDCDFVTTNFEIRQTARDQEIEALKQAKAILSGAKFEDFLQRA
mmetsp:Transcript_43615/g.81440  ORF Transcript_43615/g.81440 Transcript_43615/m.81440 type:complete len:687 (-) Transcript_43615:92-2152(-)